jgi:hypothetical protein
VYNITRFATEPIDDSSTGKLIEGVLPAFAQFDDDKGIRGLRDRSIHERGSRR